MKLSKILLSSAASAMIVLGLNSPLRAQPAEAQAQAADSANQAQGTDSVETVVVTAEKRAEKSQNVPISLTAFDASQMQIRNIADLSKLASFTPGLEITPDPGGGASIIVRGVTTGVGGVGVDPSVGVYEDGVYVSRDWVALQSYLDVSRVEVLRGPQGTLYGRNTTGGAYNIYHNMPTDTFEYGGSVEFGSYNKQRYEAYISGPVIDDKLLVRFAAARELGDDYTKNLYTGKRGKAADLIQGVGTIEYLPTSSLTITLRGDFMNDRGRVGANYHVVEPGTLNGAAQGAVLPSSPYEYTSDFPGDDNYLRNRGASADISWKFGDGYELKSITGWRKLTINTQYDTDATQLPIYTAVTNDQSRMATEEVQLTSPTDGNFDWIVGGYYYDESAHDYTTSGGPYQYGPFYLYDSTSGAALYSYTAPANYLTLNIPFDFRGVFDSYNVTHSYSGYGQARYRVTPKLQFTLGLRYTGEHRTFAGSAGEIFQAEQKTGFYNYDPATACAALLAARPVGFPVLTPSQAQSICVANVEADQALYSNNTIENRSGQSLNFNNLSERFVVDYFLDDDTHLYASATSGFKSGGFNSYDTDAAYGGTKPGQPGVPVVAFQPPFGPEKLWSYEVGAKGSAFDGRLQYAVDAFYYDWSNIQSQVYNYTNATSTVTSNAKAVAEGIELDLSAKPWEGGEIDLNGAWIDGWYTHFGSTMDDVVTGATNQNFVGFGLPGTPRWKLNLGVQHTFDLWGHGNATLRAEYQYRSKTYWVYTHDPVADAGDYNLVNLRLNLQDPDAKYTLGFYVENVFDTYYDYYRFGSSTTGVESIPGPPRMFGVKLGVAL